MYIPNLLVFNRRNLLLSSLSLCLLDSNNEEDKSNFQILTDKKKDIFFYGSLNDESCIKLHFALDELINKNIEYENYLDKNINLYLQTPGGSILPTLSVVDLIKSSPISINTHIRGYCASAGTLLSVVGNKRYMTNNSLLLIHSLRQEGQLGGNYNNIKDLYENSGTIMNIIKNIYLENTKIPKEILEYYLDHDLWLTSQKCLEYNIIDEINI